MHVRRSISRFRSEAPRCATGDVALHIETLPKVGQCHGAQVRDCGMTTVAMAETIQCLPPGRRPDRGRHVRARLPEAEVAPPAATSPAISRSSCSAPMQTAASRARACSSMARRRARLHRHLAAPHASARAHHRGGRRRLADGRSARARTRSPARACCARFSPVPRICRSARPPTTFRSACGSGPAASAWRRRASTGCACCVRPASLSTLPERVPAGVASWPVRRRRRSPGRGAGPQSAACLPDEHRRLRDAEVTSAEIAGSYPQLSQSYALHPDWQSPDLRVLLAHAESKERYGKLYRRVVYARSGRAGGCYLYYARRGEIARVLQVLARPDSRRRDARQPIPPRRRRRLRAVRGRAEPDLLDALIARRCVCFMLPPWSCTRATRRCWPKSRRRARCSPALPAKPGRASSAESLRNGSVAGSLCAELPATIDCPWRPRRAADCWRG